jgi:uroporphyrinogen-III synthase
MPAMSPWLITRASEESAPLVERLGRLGVPAAALPCIERREIEWTADLDAGSHRMTIFMVTSPFGARCLVAHWPQLRGRGRVAALAPSTAQVLERARIATDISARGGALALARAVAGQVASARPLILWLTSAAGAGEPEQEEAAAVLANAGELHRIIAYETRAPQDLPRQLMRWQGRRASAVFFSPSACRNFLAARAAAGDGPVLEHIVCIGRSTLRAWSELGAHDLPPPVYQANEGTFVTSLAPTR